MEKLIYLLWKSPELSVADWRISMCDELGPALLENGAHTLQFNLVDADVAAGEALRRVSSPPADGFVAFWIESAHYRGDCERRLREHHAAISGYVVAESCIRNAIPDPPVVTGRCHGFSLVGFAQRPAHLRRSQWLHLWLDGYTDIALATLPLFRYVQNLVVRRLTADGPPLDSIVEENLPPAALTDPMAFYDASGDRAKYEQRLQQVMNGCLPFIDFDRLNSLPMSQYRIARQSH